MITINLMQESVDVTGYQNVLAKAVVVPAVLILGLTLTIAVSIIRNARRESPYNDTYYDELDEAACGCFTALCMFLVSIGILLIPVQLLSNKIADTPRGDNAFFDRISYVAYETRGEANYRTLSDDMRDKLKEEISKKRDDLEKYGLNSDACESHKMSTSYVSVLCGGDYIKDVHTETHDLRIVTGNTTEIIKDNMPRNHIEVKDGEELFWVSVVANKYE